MTREEMLTRFHRVAECEGSEKQIDGWLDELRRALPRAHVSDLIFYSTVPRTPEEMLAEALRGEAEPMIGLPPPTTR